MLTPEEQILLRELQIRRSEENFWAFCHLLSPKFYKKDRGYLIKICDTLQAFYEGRLLKPDGTPYKKLMFEAPPRHGKQIADSTPILTLSGWKTHGELTLDDYVYGKAGNPIKVLWLSDKSTSTIEIELSTGEKIKCHENHEWTVFDRNRKREITLETKELINTFKINENTKQRNRYLLPFRECLNYSEKNLLIDPYILGVWLGNGTSNKACITYDKKDYYYIDYIKQFYPLSATWIHKTTGVYTTSFSGDNNTKDKKACSFIQHLRTLNLINNKHIPEIYKYSSKEQRLKLLAGLIDTDGHIDKLSRASISTVRKRLALDIKEIAISLGFKVCICEFEPKLTTSGIHGRQTVYVVSFNPNCDIPTLIPRKKIKRYPTQRRISITNVRQLNANEYEQGNCIQVDSPDGLYLVGKTLIPTHNSRTLINFEAWCLGRNTEERIITISYNTQTAQEFSKYTRDLISEERGANIDGLIYSDIFPESKIKHGSAAMKMWSLEGQHFSMLAAGVDGSVTSKGGTIIICDDLVKSAEEAMSETYKNKAWLFYSSTLSSRTDAEGGEPLEIICMTPWAEDDVPGRIKQSDDIENWYRLSFPACLDEEEGIMLCPEILNFSRYKYLEKIQDPMIFSANYKLTYGSLQGRLFKKENIQRFKREEIKNLIRKHRYAYIDPADKGTDSFSMPFADIYVKDGEPGIYIFDWFFEDNDVTYTAPAVANLLNKYKPEWTRIESNGAGHATMELIKLNGAKTPMLAVPNTTAKHSRIVVNAPFIIKWVHFLDPSEYKEGSPYDKAVKEFFRYMRNESDNKGHDDAPDSISDLVTMCMSFASEYFKKTGLNTY